MSAFISRIFSDNPLIDVSRSCDMTLSFDNTRRPTSTLVSHSSILTETNVLSLDNLRTNTSHPDDVLCDEEMYFDAESNKPEVVCMHCGMFGHVIEDCAMLTGDYDKLIVEKTPEFTKEYLDELISKAKKYERHLEYVSRYQKTYPDKIKEKQAKYYKKLKQECPDRYADMLKKKKQYYADKVKPNRKPKPESGAVC